MNEKIKKLRKILLSYEKEKVLVLGTYGSGIESIYQELQMGEWYEKVLDNLLIQEYGYINPNYFPEKGKKEIASQIKIKKGVPFFSHKILESDVILFLYVNPKTLKILCEKEGVSYERGFRYQNELKEKLKDVSCPVIRIELFPKNADFDTVGRNVYICDDTDYDLTDKKDYDFEDDINDYHSRFPYIKKAHSLEELKRKQGFLLIINEKYLEGKNDIEIDKKYRSLFEQFCLTYVITNQKRNFFHNKYTNVYYVSEDYFDDDVLKEIYYQYLLNQKEVKFTKRKMELLKQIGEVLKKKKVVKTSEMAKIFSMTDRSVERYMNDYNRIYKNVGYDYAKNEWYLTGT